MDFRNVSEPELERIERGKNANHMGQQCSKVPYRAMLYDRVNLFNINNMIMLLM